MWRNAALLAMTVTALALTTTPKAHAYGACHAGYTHVGPNGVQHVGYTAASGPGGSYAGGHSSAYGASGSYHAGYGSASGGAAAGGYHYSYGSSGGAAAGGYHYGAAYGGAGVYRAY